MFMHLSGRPMALVVGALVVAASSGSSSLPVQDAIQPTVTGELQCPANQFVITVDNPGDLTFQVDVDVFVQFEDPPTTSTTVGPGAVVEIPIDLGGIGDPADIVVTGDNGFPRTVFPVVFDCPQRFDYNITTPESTPVVIDLPGPCFGPTETDHGTLEETDLSGQIRYTPDPGFVGEDSFDYQCVVSAVAFGTIFITVTSAADAPVAPATPAATDPTFTG